MSDHVAIAMQYLNSEVVVHFSTMSVKNNRGISESGNKRLQGILIVDSLVNFSQCLDVKTILFSKGDVYRGQTQVECIAIWASVRDISIPALLLPQNLGCYVLAH